LWLFCLRGHGLRRIVPALALFAAVTLLWVSGLLASVGGLARYQALSQKIVGQWMWSQSPLGGHWSFLTQNLDRFGTGAVLMLLVAWLLVPLGRGSELIRRAAFLVLWAAPATLFYLLVHIGRAGYLMLIFPPAVLLAGVGLQRVWQRGGRFQGLSLLLLATAVMAAFCLQVVYGTQRQEERDFRQLAAACQPYLGRQTVALSTAGSIETGLAPERPAWPYRAVMYLLPEVRVFRFPLESVDQMGGGPNAGFGLSSARVTPPVTLPGIRYLLLTDAELRRFLPPGCLPRQLAANAKGVVLLVALDPTVPLVLGPRETLTFRCARP